jgi:hypothetical protein
VNGNTRATGFYAEAAPGFADALTRKDYVDALGTTATASTVVRRDANGWFKAWGVELFGTADNPNNAVRKDYVDSAIAAAVAGVSGVAAPRRHHLPGAGQDPRRAGRAQHLPVPHRVRRVVDDGRLERDDDGQPLRQPPGHHAPGRLPGVGRLRDDGRQLDHRHPRHAVHRWRRARLQRGRVLDHLGQLPRRHRAHERRQRQPARRGAHDRRERLRQRTPTRPRSRRTC